MTKKSDNCDPVYLSYYFDSLIVNKEMDESERRNIMSSMIQGCYNSKKDNNSDESVKPIKKKRKPSGYNLFIGDCTKTDEETKEHKDMKTCSGEWKGMNEYNKNEWRAKAAESRIR